MRRLEHNHERNNAEATRLILADPEQYGAGMVAWARLWQQRHGQQQAQDRAARGSAHARGYSRAWQRVSAQFLALHPFCDDPQGRHTKGVRAMAVDHVVPHRGDQELFWDQGNWQPLCEACHNRKTATKDSRFAHRTQGDVLISKDLAQDRALR